MERRLTSHPMRPFGLAVLAVLLAAAGAIGSTHWAQGTTAATGFSMDLYFRAGYERQVDGRTCTAASTAMMVNFIARRDLRMNQRTVLRYAQARDALNNRTQRGSDPLGWSRAATYYSRYSGKATTFRWEAFASKTAALNRAAILMARTRRPVGLVVWGGRHAVVMTGFKATSDPRKGSFRLTAVWISDPYGASHRLYSVAGVPLVKYRELDATPTYDRAWYGKYVIITPVEVKPKPVPTPSPTPTPTPKPTLTPSPTPTPTPTPPPSPTPTATPAPTVAPTPPLMSPSPGAS